MEDDTELTPGQKAARTRKRRAAATKAVVTGERPAAGKKAAETRGAIEMKAIGDAHLKSCEHDKWESFTIHGTGTLPRGLPNSLRKSQHSAEFCRNCGLIRFTQEALDDLRSS